MCLNNSFSNIFSHHPWWFITVFEFKYCTGAEKIFFWGSAGLLTFVNQDQNITALQVSPSFDLGFNGFWKLYSSSGYRHFQSGSFFSPYPCHNLGALLTIATQERTRSNQFLMDFRVIIGNRFRSRSNFRVYIVVKPNFTNMVTVMLVRKHQC